MPFEFVYIKDKPNPENYDLACQTCKHFQGFVSLWCQNETATENGYDHMGGYEKCDYWEMIKSYDEAIKNNDKHYLIITDEHNEHLLTVEEEQTEESYTGPQVPVYKIGLTIFVIFVLFLIMPKG